MSRHSDVSMPDIGNVSLENVSHLIRSPAVPEWSFLTNHARVLLCNGKHQIIATLYQATGDLIAHDEAALSESAWTRLGLAEGDRVTVTHPAQLDSLSHVRSRIYGHDLSESYRSSRFRGSKETASNAKS